MSSLDVESGPLVFLSLHVREALRTEGHGACVLRTTFEVVGRRQCEWQMLCSQGPRSVIFRTYRIVEGVLGAKDTPTKSLR